jgi:NAD(P)H-flavin reductase
VRHTTAQCTRTELIGEHIRAHFDSDLVPAPGQFLLARLTPSLDPYLRLPFFPSSLSQNSFSVDLPRHTILTPGMMIDLIGPCGAAIEENKERERVLLIADDSPAALLPFASSAIARAGAATVILARPYPLDSLDPRIEIHRGDLIALTKELAPHADRIFIHASHASLHFALYTSNFAHSSSYALLAPPTPCGVGACQACCVRTNRGYKMSCLDGPFFNLQSLIPNP